MDKIVYLACNPVAAGLVAKTEHRTGLTAYQAGKPLKAARPDVFFRKEGDMVESAEITLTPPLTTRPTRQNHNVQIVNLVQSEELRLQAEMAKLGRSFMRKAAVLGQKVTDSPFIKEGS